MDEKALADALRLSIDPPGGVNIDAWHDLLRDDRTAAWDIGTTATHLGVSPHTLRYYERIGLLTVGRAAHPEPSCLERLAA